MDAEGQVSQLEQALLRQAESLAREQQQNTETAKARILAEARERVQQAEERELVVARADAERLFRRQLQAAETRLAAELDRLRWALTEATLSSVRLSFQELVGNPGRYREVLEQWLSAAVQALPDGDLVAEVRGSDQPLLAPIWPELVARVAPGRQLELAIHGLASEGGIRVRLADNRGRLDQTFEARQARLADELARVVMERLFVSTLDLSVLVR